MTKSEMRYDQKRMRYDQKRNRGRKEKSGSRSSSVDMFRLTARRGKTTLNHNILYLEGSGGGQGNLQPPKVVYSCLILAVIGQMDRLTYSASPIFLSPHGQFTLKPSPAYFDMLRFSEVFVCVCGRESGREGSGY